MTEGQQRVIGSSRARNSSSAEVAVLGQRVTSIENILHGVVDTLNALSNKIDSKSVTNWAPISVGVTVLGLLGAIVYMPIREAQSRQELAMERILARLDTSEQRLTDKMVPRKEFENEARDNERRLERVIKRLDMIEYGNAGKRNTP